MVLIYKVTIFHCHQSAPNLLSPLCHFYSDFHIASSFCFRYRRQEVSFIHTGNENLIILDFFLYIKDYAYNFLKRPNMTILLENVNFLIVKLWDISIYQWDMCVTQNVGLWHWIYLGIFWWRASHTVWEGLWSLTTLTGISPWGCSGLGAMVLGVIHATLMLPRDLQSHTCNTWENVWYWVSN